MDRKLLIKLQSKCSSVILGALKTLRCDGKSKRPKYPLDSTGFNTIISFLNMPNPKLMSYSLSILANYCAHDEYMKMFKSSQGFHHLTLIMKTVVHPDISCRSWRLVGNLASSPDFCFIFLNNYNFEKVINQYLDELDNFNYDTKSFIFRAIGKFCCHRKCGPILPLPDFIAKILKHLKSSDSHTIQLSLTLLSQILSNSIEQEIDKNLLIRLVELSKTDEFCDASLNCLFATIGRHSFQLEGSGVVDLFISHLQKEPKINKKVLIVISKLCKESAVRNRLKVEGLLPKLATHCKGGNSQETLYLFSRFIYDIESVEILAQCPDLLSTLIANIKRPDSVSLLVVIARSLHHNEYLVTKGNLHWYASHASCRPLVLTLIRDPLYCKSVILSGIVWILFERKWVDDYATMDILLSKEELIKHYALNGNDEQRKTMAFLVPFLVSSPQLYIFLTDYGAMDIILKNLVESMTDAVLAAVVKLAQIFKNLYGFLHSPGMNHESLETMSVDTGYLSATSFVSGNMDHIANSMKYYNKDLVTFMLDDGKCVTAPKGLLCSHSPVFDSMLNGNFAEANQDRVKLKECSSSALAHLIKLLNGDIETKDLDTNIHLDLIAMSDRFLLSRLCEVLVESFKLTEKNHSDVFIWACNAGQTSHSTKLRTCAFTSILQSRETLKAALAIPECRSLLLDDLNEYLLSSLTTFQNSRTGNKRMKLM